MKKLNIYLQNLSQRKKLILGNISSFFADFLILFYFSEILDTYVTKKFVFFQLKLLGYQQDSLSQTDFLQFKGLINSNMRFVLLGFLIYHLVIYISGLLRKKWAITYVHKYALIGCILSAVEFIFYIFSGKGINIFTFFTIVFYGIAYMALDSFKKNQVQ